MKKILFFAFILLAVVACRENDIEDYSGSPCVELPDPVTCEFTDIDYVNKTWEKEFPVQVRLLGYLLDQPLTFALTCVNDSNYTMPEVRMQDSYTFEPDSIYSIAKIVVKRPAGLKEEQVGRLCFNTSSPAMQFGVGRVEYSSCEITVSTNLSPNDGRWTWDQQVWGLYSTNKYAFMMDCFGCTYDKMEHTKEKVLWVNDLYQEYLMTHDPLLDDEQDPAPIVFPVN